jgi:outer membrane lipoprotein-sorting protein
MSLALLSMISFACADVALAASPAPATVASVIVAADTSATQAAENTQPAASEAGDAEAEQPPLEAPPVFENETDEAVAEKLISYVENLDTLNGDFTQIAPSGAISSGRFYLRRPGFLRFEYDPPTPLLIVANSGLVYVRDEDLETTDSYPVGKTPLKFLLSKKIDRDDARIIGVDRGVDNVAVTFASDDEETEGELTLIANAPELELRRWIVRDLQGGLTIVTLDNVKTGERLANNLFRAPEAGGRFLDR